MARRGEVFKLLPTYPIEGYFVIIELSPIPDRYNIVVSNDLNFMNLHGYGIMDMLEYKDETPVKTLTETEIQEVLSMIPRGNGEVRNLYS